MIDIIPEFEPFKRNGRRQDTLSSEELTALFPYDEKELIEIWKRPDDMRKEQPEIALMFGTLFCVTVSAGLRSGEIRALHRGQISIENGGLLIDRAVDDRGEIGPLKKSTDEDPRSQALPPIHIQHPDAYPSFGTGLTGVCGTSFCGYDRPL
jgi:integrase